MCICRVVIENLDDSCSKADLETAFSPFGVITMLYNYNVKGNALLRYSVPDAARLAIQRMNLVPLCGCCLSVSIHVQC